MFDHISFGVKDIARTRRFYDAALKPLGFRLGYESADSIAYGRERPQLWISKSASPVPPDPDSGLHICFRADSRDAIDAFHAIALANGGTDNGPPGLRPQYTPTYYAAFVFDPDGYRIEAVTFAAE